MIIELCTCAEHPAPHRHLPTRYTVRLDTGVEVMIDGWHLDHNRHLVAEILETHPPTVTVD